MCWKHGLGELFLRRIGGRGEESCLKYHETWRDSGGCGGL